jgi:hypothetical protein
MYLRLELLGLYLQLGSITDEQADEPLIDNAPQPMQTWAAEPTEEVGFHQSGQAKVNVSR